MELTKIESPDLVISCFINENKEIEDYELINNFIPGEFGDHISSNTEYFDDYMLENAGVLELCQDVNSLYYLSLKMHWIGSGEETDLELEMLHALKVKDNYREYLDAELDYLEQLELSDKAEEVSFETNRNFFNDVFSNSSYSGLNYHEFKKIIKIIAQKDIYLAHRMAYNEELIKELGDSYNPNIMKIETRKLNFRRFLIKNINTDVRFDVNGFHLTKTYHKRKIGNSVFVSFEAIDNLEDDIMKLTDTELLEHFFDQQEIFNAFEDSKKEDAN